MKHVQFEGFSTKKPGDGISGYIAENAVEQDYDIKCVPILEEHVKSIDPTEKERLADVRRITDLVKQRIELRDRVRKESYLAQEVKVISPEIQQTAIWFKGESEGHAEMIRRDAERIVEIGRELEARFETLEQKFPESSLVLEAAFKSLEQENRTN